MQPIAYASQTGPNGEFGHRLSTELLGPLNDVEEKHAPRDLYLAGDVTLLERGPRVSVVGSRRATAAGLRRATALVDALVGRGIIVVSGLAEGIDTAAAHQAALAGGGNAYNAVESYTLNTNGTVATTFRCNACSFDGDSKFYHPTGYVADRQSNAVWGMMFLWPSKSEYRVLWHDADYTQTIIGRTKRDYVWIIARAASIPGAEYQELLQFLADEGYDTKKIHLVPQQ